jgi:hypothetical protein
MDEIKDKIEGIQIMLNGLFSGGDVTNAARSSIQFAINEAKKAVKKCVMPDVVGLVFYCKNCNCEIKINVGDGFCAECWSKN